MEACCTCATFLSEAPPVPTSKPNPKDGPPDRRLPCCARLICASCLETNPRFASYCPYCQVSTLPTALPQRLREPPPYTALAFRPSSVIVPASPAPPPYTAQPTSTAVPHRPAGGGGGGVDDEKVAEDTLHFLNHAHDTVSSLSLRYGVPASALRRHNRLSSDHLLAGRRTILIPGAYYKGGVSLSPRPIEGEEEEARKGMIRRFMVVCKVADYQTAVLYLEHSAYDVGAAVESYFADEQWERDHPLDHRKRKGGGSGGSGSGAGSGGSVSNGKGLFWSTGLKRS